MRGSGGRTKSRGSLRGKRNQSAKPNDRRLRSGSGASTPDSRRSAANRPKSNSGAATGVSVASGTSLRKSQVRDAKKSKAAPAKKRRHLERFVPEQRHLFGSDRAVKLPCPETPR